MSATHVVFNPFMRGLAALATAAWFTTAAHAQSNLTLTILHNNDGESSVINAGGSLTNFGGIARFKSVVDQLRASASTNSDGSVMLSSGDNFLAGLAFRASTDNGVFYDAIGLELIDYDAICLGNHDFDFGPDTLADFIAQFTNKPPFLSANLDFAPEPALADLAMMGIIAPRTVVTVAGQQVGVIGATTPDLASISSPGMVGINTNIASIVQMQVNTLTNMGVNKIILISHLQSIENDIALLSQLRGIDVAIAGGGDEILANMGDLLLPGDTPQGPYPRVAMDADGKTVPVVTTAGNYKYVGRLVVDFDPAGAVTNFSGGPVRVSGVAPDAVPANPAVQAQVVAPVEQYISLLQTPVASNEPILINGRGTWSTNSNTPSLLGKRVSEINTGNIVADAFLFQARQARLTTPSLPVAHFAIQNGGGIRGNDTDIPAGEITVVEALDLLPFDNTVGIATNVTTERLVDILENAVSRVEIRDGRFAHVSSNLSFTYNPTRPARQTDTFGNVVNPGAFGRILGVRVGSTVVYTNGAVLVNSNFNVATINFLVPTGTNVTGGDQYPFPANSFVPLPGDILYYDALTNYLTALGNISAAAYPTNGNGRIAISFVGATTNVPGLPELTWTIEIKKPKATKKNGDPRPLKFKKKGIKVLGEVSETGLEPQSSDILVQLALIPAGSSNAPATNLPEWVDAGKVSKLTKKGKAKFSSPKGFGQDAAPESGSSITLLVRASTNFSVASSPTNSATYEVK